MARGSLRRAHGSPGPETQALSRPGSWTWTLAPRAYPRVLRYTATALPRNSGMLCRSTAYFVIARPRYHAFYGTTAALKLPVPAFRCLVAWQAWPAGFCMASTAVHLPQYRAFRALTTAQPSHRAARYTAYRATAGLR